MYTEITLSSFRDAFQRADRYEQFSHEALEVIFDYYEAYENDTGEKIELDVIAICCELSESDYDTIIADYYLDDINDDDEKIERVREYLENNTTVLGEVNGGFVFVQF